MYNRVSKWLNITFAVTMRYIFNFQIALLQKESELPLDELLARYKEVCGALLFYGT